MIAVHVYNDAGIRHLPRMERRVERTVPVSFRGPCDSNSCPFQVDLTYGYARSLPNVWMPSPGVVVVRRSGDRAVTRHRLRRAAEMLVRTSQEQSLAIPAVALSIGGNPLDASSVEL